VTYRGFSVLALSAVILGAGAVGSGGWGLASGEPLLLGYGLVLAVLAVAASVLSVLDHLDG
jgi:hypothetical protein